MRRFCRPMASIIISSAIHSSLIPCLQQFRFPDCRPPFPIPVMEESPLIRPESVPSARSLQTNLLYRDFGFVLAHTVWRTRDCDALYCVVGTTGTVAEWR